MKITRINSGTRGSTLLMVCFICFALAMMLATYLAMTSQENVHVKRSTGWNSALTLAEAGIEEACSQVNANSNGYWPDGWAFNTNTFAFNKQRLLGDGYYSVDINGWAGSVVAITSTGYGAWTGSNYITRIVQVTAQTPVPYIPSGLIANTVSFSGSFSADSYDSRNSLYSTKGQYDSRKATDHALIASPQTAFNISGNMTVRGFVAAGVGGIVTVSGNSTCVGDASYNGRGIQTSPINHSTNGFTLSLPTIPQPYGPGTPGVRVPTGGTVAGKSYDYVLNGGLYIATNLTATLHNGSMYVSSNATLLITGDGSGLNSITYNSDTNVVPKLSVFVATPSLTFGPVLINAGAPQLWVYGLPTCTDLKITKIDFVGVIFAPNVNLTAAGGGSISGAIVAKSFTCNGNFDFHYDDATGGNAAKPFQIRSWAEL